MNYKLVYKKFIEYCKYTDIKTRLKNRNIKDERINKKYIYKERHHIIPKSINGSNDDSNLVYLLPEEHIFAHMVRWKAYKDRCDMLAVRFCLNGIKGTKNTQLFEIKMSLNKKLRSGYAWLKQNSAEMRLKHDWQTPEGIKRISESRKGQISVVDAITRESKGCVTKDHPKYISGEWVHHSKGRKLSKEEAEGKACPGEKNGRYSGVTDKEILQFAINVSCEVGRILSHDALVREGEIRGLKIPKFFAKFRFNGRGYKELIRLVEIETKLTYNPYYRSAETRKRISETLKKKGKNDKD